MHNTKPKTFSETIERLAINTRVYITASPRTAVKGRRGSEAAEREIEERMGRIEQRDEDCG